MNNEVKTEILHQKLAASGLRSTRQREIVYDAILTKRDHPTADEIFARAKQEMPTISLATVYNCLDTLVQCDLVKQVHLERESTRYCPNLTEHAHFHDNESGTIYDVQLDPATISKLTHLLPQGFDVSSIDITFRGKAAAEPIA
ncbi:transcriptional repressor [Pelagicoccus sp. SDUM812002]|uniref:Fur family transcriptional regulator n=1 Tax=Pelagicoccus sp. SDUM812002 TaxID=3041266 RepID=UPI00280DB725|nr:transcriptional repressor [Pelagicoccus sp. SDUM812002]MDQ8185596.1 transcriptional repressor [Pelagicoccus sp. SDUM812002]